MAAANDPTPGGDSSPPVPTSSTPPPPPPAPAGGGEADSSTRTFTQAEVDALLGRARNQGSSSAKREVAELLGVSLDEAKAILDKRLADEQAQMTEAQRLASEAASARAEAEAVRSEAQREILRARITTALNEGDSVSGALPVRPDRVSLAADLAVSRALAAPDGEDPVVFGIEFVRGQSPEWFAAPGSPLPPAPAGVPTPPPPGRPGAERPGVAPSGTGVASRFEAWKAKNKRPDVLASRKE